MVLCLAILALLLCACDSDTQSDDASTECAPSGQLCTSDDDCEESRCVADRDRPAVDLEPLSLVCGCEADGREVGQSCQKPEDCAFGICLLAKTWSRPCLDDRHCGSNQRCSPVYAQTSETTFQPFRGCVSIAELPEGIEIDSQVYEDFFTASSAGDPIDLPPVDPTTLFVFEHLAEDAWPAMMTRCRSPICVDQLATNDVDPVILFDSDRYSSKWENGQDPPLNPVGSGTLLAANQSHPVTVMLPNGPRSMLSDFGFRALLVAETQGDLRLTELSGVSHGVRLDLNIFYVGGLEPALAEERGPPLLQEALSVFESIYSQAEIEIGQVRQFEVVGGLLDRFETIELRYGILEELPRLFALSAGANGPAINLFFVREIYETLAISGGMPGPLGMHGTGASGIAFSSDSLDDGELLGKVIAHEIGHYLGLFHTSEQAGFVLDPLPDTPECRLDRDSDGDGMLSIDECRDFGADNLMFWAIGGGTDITADQKAVLRSALILR
jgi:hypothetical protein